MPQYPTHTPAGNPIPGSEHLPMFTVFSPFPFMAPLIPILWCPGTVGFKRFQTETLTGLGGEDDKGMKVTLESHSPGNIQARGGGGGPRGGQAGPQACCVPGQWHPLSPA